MFDGIARLPMYEPTPPRPAPLDTRRLLPLLRAQEAEVAVSVLARVVAINADTAARWLATNWGLYADLSDPQHPARAAMLEPSAPTWKLAEAQDALASACRRYRDAAG